MKFNVNLQVTGTIESVDNEVPPEPPDPDWPNKPAGFKILNEWDCNGTPEWTSDGSSYIDEPIEGSGGWRCIYNHSPGTLHPNDPAYGVYAGTPYGWTECINDDIYRFTYPEGMREGIGPSTCYLAWGLAAGIREIYIGMRWKPSENFDLSNNGTKIAFIFNGGGGQGGQIFMALDGSKRTAVLPEYLPVDDTYYMHNANVDLSEVVLGAWHDIEWYVNLDTHILRWWINGKLTGDYDDLVPNSFNFDMFQLSPTYGGCCSHTRPYQCNYEYDKTIIAIPNVARVSRKKSGFQKLIGDYKLPVQVPWPKKM